MKKHFILILISFLSYYTYAQDRNIATNQKYTASIMDSVAYPAHNPRNAFDGDTSTAWHPQAYPTQWIAVYFTKSYDITRLKFWYRNSPASNTIQEIYSTTDSINWNLVETISPYHNISIGSYEHLLSDTIKNSKGIMIRTTQNASWIQWREIEVFSPYTMNDDLIASYPFNGNANDESGNGNDGILNGNLSIADRFGYSNAAYTFNGTSDYIELPNIIPVFKGSISYWFRTSNIIESQVLVYHTNTIDNGFGTIHDAMESHTGISGEGYNAFVIDNGAGTGFTDSIVQVELDTWYHVAFTYDTQDSARMYINGRLVNSTDLSAEIGTYLPTSTYIGRPSMSTRYFSGVFDDLGIWGRILSAEEVQELYHENEYAIVTDIDGNKYNTVTIGSQTWMAENLKTTTYNDGTPIPNVTDNTEWSNLSTDAYCWYNNDEATNKVAYGALYNWYAVETEKLCPAGWHVPTDNEWKALEIAVGMSPAEADKDWLPRGLDEAGKLKETELIHWASPNDGATNEFNFTALPAGYVGINGVFDGLSLYALFWTSTPSESQSSYYRGMYYTHPFLNRSLSDNRAAYSVRCLEDSEMAISMNVQDATVNEGQGLKVPISVSELTVGDNIISYQFDIDYDNTVIEYFGTDIDGTLAEGGTVTVNSSVEGQLNVSYMNSTALVGAGDLLRLQFNTLKADTTAVTVSNAYLNSTEVSDLSAGTVIIKDITPPTAAITYDDTENRCGDDLLITATFSEPMLTSNAVNISLSGGAALADAVMTRISETVYTFNYSVPRAHGDVTLSLSSGTDLWSNEVVSTPTSGGSFTISGLTLGDVDNDGKILAYDAALTLQYSVGLDPLPAIDALPWENWRDSTANVDGTAGITANDAGMILQYSAGIITAFLGSSKKSAPQAFISMEFANDGIVFYSYGRLLGLNVSVDNEFQILGKPIILGENFMSAFNINDKDYKVGLCTARPPADGTAILKIPFNRNGSVNINMIVNDVQKSMALNLSTGITDFGMNGIIIYPNPVRDILKVRGLSSETVARIYNLNGNLLHTSMLSNSESEINVSDLAVGLHIIKLETDKEITVKRFIIR
jgi:uncharacterized protein (TIGR02145 family)